MESLEPWASYGATASRPTSERGVGTTSDLPVSRPEPKEAATKLPVASSCSSPSSPSSRPKTIAWHDTPESTEIASSMSASAQGGGAQAKTWKEGPILAAQPHSGSMPSRPVAANSLSNSTAEPASPSTARYSQADDTDAAAPSAMAGAAAVEDAEAEQQEPRTSHLGDSQRSVRPSVRVSGMGSVNSTGLKARMTLKRVSIPNICAIEAAVQDLQEAEEDSEDEDGSDTSSVNEDAEAMEQLLAQPPKLCRRLAVSSEAHGQFNQRRPAKPSRIKKPEEHTKLLLQTLRLRLSLCETDLEVLQDVVDSIEVQKFPSGQTIVKEGFKVVQCPGGHALVSLARASGEKGCATCGKGYRILEDPWCCRSCRWDLCADCYWKQAVPDPAFVVVAGRAIGHATSYKDGSGCTIAVPEQFFQPGEVVNEPSMLWCRPNPQTVSAAGDAPCEVAFITREIFEMLVVQEGMDRHQRREELLKNVPAFETLDYDQMGKIADVLQLKEFKSGDVLVRQGDQGDELFIMMEGECAVTIATGAGPEVDIQEHRRCRVGDLFGERALLQRALRAATVTACTDAKVLCLTREKLERILGPLDLLQQSNYPHDPRKLIADFYRPGNQDGPLGMCGAEAAAAAGPGEATEWFAVYRPTSRDAIAKMLSGVAVGKGLNVKGKSAKKGPLSGFVPFMQISQENHKYEIEESPPDARMQIYFQTEEARDTVRTHLDKLVADRAIDIKDRRIRELNSYEGIFGLDIPEPAVREGYIMRQSIVFMSGWETGRVSMPAFMDMNLHTVRDPETDPKVVLYQFDTDNPMNPHGLLVAYAESTVKPVVSDFDTFTVGSRNMQYKPLEQNQLDLAHWLLDRTREILADPSQHGWTTRWLEVRRVAEEQGHHVDVPKFGFGDATSYSCIEEIIKYVKDCGAVRHGAECFNFYFPQELDDEYLIVWNEFPDKPWAYMDEDRMRDFLMERVLDGYSMPLNPVWIVRDHHWFELLEAIKENPQAFGPLKSWFPDESGLLEKIEALHHDFPDGFELGVGRGQNRTQRSMSQFGDLDSCERAELAKSMLKKKHWGKVKAAVRFLKSATTLTLGGT